MKPTEFPLAWPDRLKERASQQVERSGDCWLWRGGTVVHGGYRQIRHGSGPKWLAHRLTYTLTYRPLAAGEEVDHLCRRSNCINPDHLEAVSRAENLRRRDERRASQARSRDAELAYWVERALSAEAALQRQRRAERKAALDGASDAPNRQIEEQ